MRIRANDILMNYELSGREDAPVVLLSHSLSSSLIMWDPQMEALEEHFRVLRYDIRGHGMTDAPSGKYTLQMLGEDALALMDALGLERVHWVGLSMGGMIGQYVALHHTPMLRSLVLCDTAALIPQEAQPLWDKRIEAARKLGMAALVEGTLERWFTAPYLKAFPPMVKRIQDQVLATPVQGFIGCSEAIRRLNYLGRLSEIDIPTLIIVGEEDPGTPVSASQAMHEQIPGSRLVVLPSAAHLSNIEQTEAFNEALIPFLLEH